MKNGVVMLVTLLWTATNLHAHTLDPHHLPLGDGKVSSEPRSGYVYSCQQDFSDGRGAQHAGDWIQGSTCDVTAKLAVQGEVLWPNAEFTISASDSTRRLLGNGLPLDHSTGIFPIQRNDPAFQYDRNPNRITEQHISVNVPRNPELQQTATCVPMGMIGVTLDGVAFFNALDADGRDAVAHEVQDKCNGHPQHEGQYHYHGPSSCVPGASERNHLLGYALDGFGIYSGIDEMGKEISNDELDECHGTTSPVLWDGKRVTMYHYVMTREYPYTIGCFRGQVDRSQFSRPESGRGQGMNPGMRPGMNGDMRNRGMQGEQGMQGEPQQGMRRPPQEALDACNGSSDGAHCEFVSPRGDNISGTCRARGNNVACVPDHRR